LKGTTCDAVELRDPLPVGCTMTCVAAIVVPLVVPRTRTWAPVFGALAEVVTVTFCPAGVDTTKPDVETLLTVPDVPPVAGPDRALDPLVAVDAIVGVCPLLAPAELPPELALTIP
jgi:hypothetical protein